LKREPLWEVGVSAIAAMTSRKSGRAGRPGKSFITILIGGADKWQKVPLKKE
jgi:hypothetical protein